MIEIIIIFVLTRKIRKIAEQKGLSKGQWTFRMIFSWIIGEFILIFLGMSIFGFDVFENDHFLLIGVMGIVGGYLGYLLTINSLNNHPESLPPKVEEEKDLSYFR